MKTKSLSNSVYLKLKDRLSNARQQEVYIKAMKQ